MSQTCNERNPLGFGDEVFLQNVAFMITDMEKNMGFFHLSLPKQKSSNGFPPHPLGSLYSKHLTHICLCSGL